MTTVVVFWEAYLGGRNKHFLPRFDTIDVNRLPAILTVVNPVDPLRDDGVDFTLNLVDKGARGELHMLPGTFHSGLMEEGTHSWKTVSNLICDFVKGVEADVS